MSIPSSPGLKTLLLLLSVAAHGVLLLGFHSPAETRIAGGGGAVIEARLGNSFADMAEGAQTAQASEVEAEAPVEADVPDPPEPQSTKTPSVKPLDALTPEPLAAETPRPTKIVPMDVAPVPGAIPPLPVEAVPSKTALVSAPEPAPQVPVELPMAAAPVPAVPETTEATPRIEPPAPDRPLERADPAPPETLAATEDQALESSPRPTARPKRPKPKTPTPKKQSPQKAKPKPQKQGNSRADGVAGSATGSDKARAKTNATASGTGGGSGNAAVSNYAGKVHRKIQRVRKPRVSGRAKVWIRFSIKPNGGLASISLVKGSGSARLDRAALQVIRKAAPFPKPPPGAQRSFKIPIEFGRR
ncbi:MAG: TonB family protein [Silicimonas sp.]|nr:TonB family protein [Silicimonas sp.]